MGDINMDRAQVKEYGQERYHEYMLRKHKEEMTSKKFTLTVESDGEDLVLPFPADLMNQMGWNVGDTLLWETVHDGYVKSVSVRKVER